MTVEVERAGAGVAAVDRSPSARVVALRPHVGRHAATGTSPEVAALVDTAPAAHPARHLPGGWAAQEPDGRPLVRELEDLVGRMHRRGPTRSLTAELTEVLSAWAAALLRLHRTPLSAFAPDAPRPWVLDEPLPDWLDELPPQAGPVWAVRAHPAVGRAVQEAAAAWTAAQWTHGEPTGDEVAITRVHGAPRAVLLGGAPRSDGRSPAGCGDPRWDVATVLDWIAIALGPVLDPAWEIDPVAVFVAEYRDLGGDATPTRAMAVARTLGTAIEWSAQLVLAGEAGDDELAWLSGLWTRPLELVGAARPGAARRR
ncbi:hypothetical protein [Cellulomonas sp. ICMP 17802]|uniref:hypothetical protein n=1 Tax=Cellulomonas sp. ICMP 17802 TaxID=3239199 RepID=UPI00351B287E